MNVADIDRLVRYNDWANHRVLDALRGLSAADLSQDLGGSFPTLAAVFGHVVSAEWIWLERWSGTTPAELPVWVDSTDLEEFAAILDEVETERRRRVETLQDEDLERVIEYRYLSGVAASRSLADILQHVVNHSTYHRGQMAAMIRRLGVAPPSTDLIFFEG